jgi:hypothetical protein
MRIRPLALAYVGSLPPGALAIWTRCDLAGFTHPTDSLRINVKYEALTLVRNHLAVMVKADEYRCAGSVLDPPDRAIVATAAKFFRYVVHVGTIVKCACPAYPCPSDSHVGANNRGVKLSVPEECSPPTY